MFAKTLTDWYGENKRDLPFRKTKEPYKVWISEIILQQTRVQQGLSYYLKFIEKYPTVSDLANAEEEAVLKLWQGLGYYSRARNLHFSAKYIRDELNGSFPTNYKDLLKLKGVGDYTASAIASICFDEPTAVVDGNVYRVLARFFGISTAINSTKGIKDFKELAQSLLDKSDPGTYNQAIMEFGAIVCKPQNPVCIECKLSERCYAYSNRKIEVLPVKEKKIKIRHRYFNYLVIHSAKNELLLERRSEGIWKNLYQFPLIESDKQLSEKALLAHAAIEKHLANNEEVHLLNEEPIVHKLTHQHIYANFWSIRSASTYKGAVPFEEIHQYPVPKLIENFLNEYTFTEQ
jgi:A/G-specific adenine glycosylase